MRKGGLFLSQVFCTFLLLVFCMVPRQGHGWISPSSYCGNGYLESGEICDDGNTVEGDGCSATCQVEPGYDCSGSPSECWFTGIIETQVRPGFHWKETKVPGHHLPKGFDQVMPQTCGNSQLDPGEQCDEGKYKNGTAGSCCDKTCHLEGAGNQCDVDASGQIYLCNAIGECQVP